MTVGGAAGDAGALATRGCYFDKAFIGFAIAVVVHAVTGRITGSRGQFLTGAHQLAVQTGDFTRSDTGTHAAGGQFGRQIFIRHAVAVVVLTVTDLRYRIGRITSRQAAGITLALTLARSDVVGPGASGGQLQRGCDHVAAADLALWHAEGGCAGLWQVLTGIPRRTTRRVGTWGGTIGPNVCAQAVADSTRLQPFGFTVYCCVTGPAQRDMVGHTSLDLLRLIGQDLASGASGASVGTGRDTATAFLGGHTGANRAGVVVATRHTFANRIGGV